MREPTARSDEYSSARGTSPRGKSAYMLPVGDIQDLDDLDQILHQYRGLKRASRRGIHHVQVGRGKHKEVCAHNCKNTIYYSVLT